MKLDHQSLMSRAARLTVAAFTFHSLANIATIGAQLPTISGGTRVRLEQQPTGEKLSGTVFSQSADSLAIASGGVVRMIPTESIARMQVSSGRSHSHGAYLGALIGGTIIGVAGLVVFSTSYTRQDGAADHSDLSTFVLASAFSGAFYGAIIGGVVGAENWTPVYGGRVGVAVRRPASGATGMGLALKF